MEGGCSSVTRTGRKALGLALLTAVSLVGASCGGDEEARTPAAGEAPASPSPGLPFPVDEEPTPAGEGGGAGGGGAAGTQPAPEETGVPPPPGEAAATEFEVVVRGTDPVAEQAFPQVLLATNPEEGAAAASASPAAGAAEIIRDWDQYGERSVVAVLGGSQPDPTHRVTVRDVNILKNGSWLLAFGRISRDPKPAAQVISVPWVILSFDAEETDVVTECTIALEGAQPFSNPCP